MSSTDGVALSSVICMCCGKANEITEDYSLPSECDCGFPGGLPTIKELFVQAWSMGRSNGMIDGVQFGRRLVTP